MTAFRAPPHRPPLFAGDRKVSAWTSAEHDIEVRHGFLIDSGDISEIQRLANAVNCAVGFSGVLVDLAEK